MNTNENAEFPLTRISLIARVKDVDGGIRQQALSEFAESYRPALISFLVRCKGIAFEEAEDIVHDFMLNKIMNGKVLELAGKKGRFRALLRTCLQNYLVDQIRKDQRVPQAVAIDLEESSGQYDGQDFSPIDQVWAIALFREALMVMQGESDYWGLFKDRVLTQPPLGYDEVVVKHGFDNPTKASNALMTAKRQFNRIIEDLISKQTYLTENSSKEELKSEIEFLRAQLADSNLVEMVCESLARESNQKESERSVSDSIFSDRLLLIDESADANWHKTEVTAILNHLIKQPIGQIVDGIDSVASIESFLRDMNEQKLDAFQRLKQHFNQEAKTGNGVLPERVNVTMTFACIAAYVLSGGQLEDVTSTRRDVMAGRLEQLTDKEWIPDELRTLFHAACKLRLPN